MEKSGPHHFHLRLPKELFAEIETGMRRKGGSSLNREIVERLQASTERDPAAEIVDALRPLMSQLDDEDRQRFTKLTVEAVQILASANKKRPRKR